MILVLALTQFAFLVLGIVFLKILVNATTGTLPLFVTVLNGNAMWLLVIPLIWAFLVSAFGRGGGALAEKVTRASGAAVAVLCFCFLAAVAYLFTQ